MSGYRSDIDGLRCLAILPVVFYHFGIVGFGGGFVGVDVFFVISGYLIGGMTFDEIRHGRFSLLRFYERRVRRIAPALLALLAATIVASWFLVFPTSLQGVGRSVVWTVFFVSNIGFWRETGYFDPMAETMPLLHTWSLSVEEQFYLFFPPLLLALRNISRRTLLALLAAATLASFFLGAWMSRNSPQAVFFLIPARAWEMGIGAFLAIGAFPSMTRPAREALTFAGAALIVGAVVFFGDGRPPYLLNLLLPCIGAGLLLYGGREGATVVGAILSWRPVVFVGLISYSLYLWHWPVFVFYRYVSIGLLSLPEKVALVALSFVLAVLSWRFIERPFRGRSGLWTRRKLFVVTAVASAGLLIAAGGILAGHGWPQRFSPSANKFLASAGDRGSLPADCLLHAPGDLGKGSLCQFGSRVPDAAPFILWGDSHANAIEPGLAQWAASHRRKGIFLVRLGCVPLPGTINSAHPECSLHNDQALTAILGSPVKDIVLSGLWGMASEGVNYDASPPAWTLTDGSAGPAGNHAVFARALRRMVTTLQKAGKNVILIASVPENKTAVPETLAKIAIYGRARDIRPSMAEFQARQAFVMAQFQALQREGLARVVYPHAVLCASGRCAVEKDGNPLYGDSHHLSAIGARTVMQGLDRDFTTAMGN